MQISGESIIKEINPSGVEVGESVYHTTDHELRCRLGNVHLAFYLFKVYKFSTNIALYLNNGGFLIILAPECRYMESRDHDLRSRNKVQF